jgi:hypothetical protein
VGSLSFLPVKHFTSQSDVYEGGWLIAMDGDPLPTVFVGYWDDLPAQTDAVSVDDLRTLGSALNQPTIKYATMEELILDGWRPE